MESRSCGRSWLADTALTGVCTAVSISVMSRVRRVTANLPEDVLKDAMAVTGEGVKIHRDVDLSTSPERRRR